MALQSAIVICRLVARSASAASRAKSTAAPRIHHRQHDVAFTDQALNASEVGQSSLARKRLAASLRLSSACRP
jgi:hypothetical protein